MMKKERRIVQINGVPVAAEKYAFAAVSATLLDGMAEEGEE